MPMKTPPWKCLKVIQGFLVPVAAATASKRCPSAARRRRCAPQRNTEVQRVYSSYSNGGKKEKKIPKAYYLQEQKKQMSTESFSNQCW